MDAKKSGYSLFNLKKVTGELRDFFAKEVKKIKKNPKKIPKGYTPETRAMFLEFFDHAQACFDEINNLMIEIKQFNPLASEEDIEKIIEDQKREKLTETAHTIFVLTCASNLDISQCLAFANSFDIDDLNSFDQRIGLSPLAATMLRRDNALAAMKAFQRTGVDFNTISSDGNNIAHLAVLFGVDKKIVNFLIKKNVNFNLINKNGMTPLDVAVGRRDLDFIKYLINKAKAKFKLTPIKLQKVIKFEKEKVKRKWFFIRLKKDDFLAQKEEIVEVKKEFAKDSLEIKDFNNKQNIEEKTFLQKSDDKKNTSTLVEKSLPENQAQRQLIFDDDQANKEKTEETQHKKNQEGQQKTINPNIEKINISEIKSDFLNDFILGIKLLKAALSKAIYQIKYSIEEKIIDEAQILTEDFFLNKEQNFDLQNIEEAKTSLNQSGDFWQKFVSKNISNDKNFITDIINVGSKKSAKSFKEKIDLSKLVEKTQNR